MEIKLKEHPKHPVIIEGFPGLGLVGTIATEFLVQHLKARLIGEIWSKELPPIIAIHDSTVVQPLGIFYDEKHNIVILHAVSGIEGIEWDMADEIIKIGDELEATQIISLESVGSLREESQNFHYTNNEKSEKRFKEIGVEKLKEGIVIGVTGALLNRVNRHFSVIFAETHSTLPDSKAAAQVIEVLNKYLNLEIDTEPLLKSAEQFEQKLKSMMEQTQQAKELSQEKKKLSYLG